MYPKVEWWAEGGLVLIIAVERTHHIRQSYLNLVFLIE